ncbi:MAG: hypothetical protein ACQCN3_12170 [Candidatus Bathyarchaeia archaeon]
MSEVKLALNLHIQDRLLVNNLMLTQKVSRFKEPLLIAGLILGFFTLMSRIDFIVHSTLYEYGLKFSYEWANDYWLTYNSIFYVFGIALGLIYWAASKKTLRDIKLSLAIAGTIALLTVGGLQDILYFVLWEGGLPQNSVVWWWMPWTSIVGTWNSLAQIALTTLTSTASIGIIFGAFKRKPAEIAFVKNLNFVAIESNP